MNATQIARRADALYSDGSTGITRRVLCDMVARREADIDQLKAENAKHRKLLRDVHSLHWNGLDCTECPWFDECDTTGGCPWLSIFTDHMRELGIEVDG